MYAIPAFLNDLNPANLSNPSSLQINSQPVAEGAGGRGEALDPPRQAEGRTLGVFNRGPFQSAPGIS